MTRKYKKTMSKNSVHSNKKEFIVGAFDIETLGLGGRYLDGFTAIQPNGRATDHEIVRHASMRELFEYLCEFPQVTWYAHNARNYEFSYLIQMFQENEISASIKPIVQGESNIIGMLIDLGDKTTLELRDSLALMPMSLADATKAFSKGSQKISGAIDFAGGEVYDPTNAQHVEYNIADVTSLVDTVLGFDQLVFRAFGVHIRYTTASTALECWFNSIAEGVEYERISSKTHESEIRESYYGGFVYPGSSIEPHDDITSVDRNAAYAAAMKQGVPYGKPTRVFEFDEELMGVYSVSVVTPEYTKGFVPCIPMRSNNTLLWPTGSFDTSVSSAEIKYARTKGYVFTVKEGLIFPEIVYPFNDFCDKCNIVERNAELKPASKLMRNGLYGKFGTNPDTQEFYIGDTPGDGFAPVVDEVTGELNFNLFRKGTTSEANYIMPQWALFITAHQRIWLFETIDAVGAENVVYCDTDSVKAKTSAVNKAISENKITIDNGLYGASKVDEEYKWFQCLGPKVYRGMLKEGKEKMRAKGLQKKLLTFEFYDEMYDAIVDDIKKAVKTERAYIKMLIKGTRSAMAMCKDPGKEIAVERKRRITDIRNSNTWELKETDIVPPKVINGIKC